MLVTREVVNVKTGEVTIEEYDDPKVLDPAAVAARDAAEIAAVAAAAAAVSDFLQSKPGFAAQLAAALARLDTGVGTIQAQCDAISTSATTSQVPTIITALQTATIRSNSVANCAADTQTAVRNIGTVLESMRTAHNLEAQAIKDIAVYLRKDIQVLASSLGIPLS